MRLFTRTTLVTVNPEETVQQQANISVFVYDNVEHAWHFFSESLTEEQWKKQLDHGEGFYVVEAADEHHTNIVFLETRLMGDG